MKYIKFPIKLFLWMLLGTLVGLFVSTAISELYRFLNEIMPNAFPSYDITSNKRFFDTLYTSLWFISLVITTFITVYISLRHDNEKFELIISKSEGFYEIHEILPTYVDIFLITDILSAAVSGTVFTIPFTFIPMQFIKNESFLAKLSEPYKMMSECFGAGFAPIVLTFIIAICYVATVPLALKYYRARWFSAFSEA